MRYSKILLPFLLLWSSVYASNTIATVPLISLVSQAKFQFITGDPENYSDYRAAISPNGKDIVVERTLLSGNNMGKTQLYIMNINGKNARPLFSDSFDCGGGQTRPSWSAASADFPLGRIAFSCALTSEGLNDATLWVYNPAKSKQDPMQVSDPQFSSQIMYPYWLGNTNSLVVTDYANNVLWFVKLNHKNKVKQIQMITQTSVLSAGMASISPNIQSDNANIAVAAQPPSGNYQQDNNKIWTFSIDPSNPNAENFQPIDFSNVEGRTPAWSPKGKWVIFESGYQWNPYYYAIYAKAYPDGDTLYQLTPSNLNANHPVFTPDGKYIILTAEIPAYPKTPSDPDPKEPWGLVKVKLPEMLVDN